jgi:hypothetical protein
MIRNDVRETLVVAVIVLVLVFVIQVCALGLRGELVRVCRGAFEDARARGARLREALSRTFTRRKREGHVVNPNRARALPYDG